MTTPTIVSSKYVGNDTDFGRCKVDRSGALRLEQFSATVPSGTASGTLVGLVPFNKGARFDYSSTVYVPDMDSNTDLVLNVGYVYDDNTTYTNDTDAFASAVTTGQAGGFITFDEEEGITWVAEADGWIVLEIGTGGTASAADALVIGQANVSYDG